MYHGLYADDTQIYVEITPDNSATTIPELQACLKEIQNWMDENIYMLKLNPDKTEFIIYGDKRSTLSNIFPVTILDNLITPISR